MTQAYNLVAGKISTFLDAIIPMNNHLYNLYIFTFQNYTNYYKNRLKIYYNIKIKIYFMLGSSNYIIKMNHWFNNKYQRNLHYLMINEICREFD